jgi:hypothetical protein
MAAVEPLGSADPMDTTRWLIVRGTLREADLPSLLEQTDSSDAEHVTLDLFNLDLLTPGGCWTIRSLADDLWRRGRQLTVVYSSGPVADALRTSGTLQPGRAIFQRSPADSEI